MIRGTRLRLLLIGIALAVAAVLAIRWGPLFSEALEPAGFAPVAVEAEDSQLGDDDRTLPVADDSVSHAAVPVLEAPSTAVPPEATPGLDPLTIAVACEDPEGEPLGGCLVEVRHAAAGGLLVSAFTDAAGHASLQVSAAETHVLRASMEDGSSSGDRTLRAWERRTLEEREDGVLRLVLYPQLTLSGTVRRESGATLEGASVSVRPPGVRIGGSDPAPVEPALSDAHGRFALRVDGVPGQVIVQATEGGRHSKPESLSLPDEATRALELVILESGYEVSGVVRAPDGCDVVEALVVLVPSAPEARSSTTKTAPDGAFHFDLKGPGQFQLAARSGTCVTSVPVTASTDPELRSARVELLLESTSRLSGRIEWASGEPLRGAVVAGIATESETGDDALLRTSFARIAEVDPVLTDERGAFHIDGLSDRHVYQLVCVPDPSRPECWVREEGVRPGSSDVVIVVDEARIRGGVWSGSLAWGEGRVPSTELTFVVYERYPDRAGWGAGRQRRPVMTDGGFRFEGLVIGNAYYAEVHAPGCATLSVGPWTATEAEERTDLTFGLDGELTVRLRDAIGEPSSDWIVSLDQHGDGPPAGVRLKPEEADGIVRYRPIAAGHYRVSARQGERELGPFDVEIFAGLEAELEIEVGRE